MTISMPKSDRDDTIKRYSTRYKKFGYSPLTLGWDKGKQNIRFDVLTSEYDFSGKSILDIGCGFGDLNKVLQEKFDNNYIYTGVDLVPALVSEARLRYSGKNHKFIVDDFLDINIEEKFDYALASGVFNHSLSGADNYELIEATIDKALSLTDDGVAFDFLSDKVDYKHDHTFHSSPEKILSIAYKFSRNIILRNDYMPFEFSIFIFKDDSFSIEDTLFHRYRSLKQDE